MRNRLLKPLDASQRFFSPAHPLSPEESEQQVKLMTSELMREFEQKQHQSAPLSEPQQRRLHNDYNTLLHSNRIKERKLQDLQQALSQLTILNGGVPEDVRRSPDPRTRVQSLLKLIGEEEEKIEEEERETERIEYMKQRTSRATQEGRIRCMTLQKQCALLLGKYSEVQDLEAKSRYGLQHVKSQNQIYADSARKVTEKRVEKLGHLKRDKQDIQESTSRLVKSLAEEIVKGQTSKTLAETRAQQLDVIYTKHTHSLAHTRQDFESKENLQRALRTICEVVNRSETLGLERPLKEVRLEDLIVLTHQFEMKLSSLESQVESLSMAKHDLELNCAAVRAELRSLHDSQFQAAELMTKLQTQMVTLGISHPASTFNQLKTFLESKDTTIPGGDDALRQDAFLSSSYMTLHVVTKRLMTMLDYISRMVGQHPTKLAELVQALWTTQKHGERLELAYGQATPSNSERGEIVDAWEQDSASASWFFREALDDVTGWGLDPEPLIKEACDMLLVRIFAQDARLRVDLRAWKSSQLDIVSESLHRMVLERLVVLSHVYLKGRFGEVFALLRNLVGCIAETAAGIESEVDRQALEEAQLCAFVDFKTTQLTGVSSKPTTVTERSVNDILRKAYEKKYQKLLSQQHEFKLEEESAEFMQHFRARPKPDIPSDVPNPDSPPSNEGNMYAASSRLAAKTASLPTLLHQSTSARVLHSGSPSKHESEAFAEVRSINSRIRAIRDIEKPPSLLPELRPPGKVQAPLSNRQRRK
jgi:hypothetical protein